MQLFSVFKIAPGGPQRDLPESEVVKRRGRKRGSYAGGREIDFGVESSPHPFLI